MDARIIITPPKSYTYFQRTEHADREIARARLRNEKSRCGARGPRSNAGVIMRARTLDLARSPRTRIYIYTRWMRLCLTRPLTHQPLTAEYRGRGEDPRESPRGYARASVREMERSEGILLLTIWDLSDAAQL